MSAANGQGLPWEPAPRGMPWLPSPSAWSLGSVRTADGAQFVALTIDTPSGRTVTFWSPDDIEKMARRLLAFVGKALDGLVIADMSALKDLRP